MKGKFIVFFLFCISIVFSQDSLVQAYKKAELSESNDTLRLKYLNFIVENENDESIWPAYNLKMLHFSEMLLSDKTKTSIHKNVLYYKANALNNIGLLHSLNGLTDSALYNYNKSLDIQKQLENHDGMAQSYNNIGAIYNYVGNVPRAVEYFLLCIKEKEITKDIKGKGFAVMNIAYIYAKQKDFDNALKYYKSSSELFLKSNEKVGYANSLLGLGDVYFNLKDLPKAMEYYIKSNSIYSGINNQRGQGFALYAIANVYSENELHDDAIRYYEKSLEHSKKINDIKAISGAYRGLSKSWYNKNDINKALDFAEKSLKLAKDLGHPDNISSSAKLLYSIYLKKNNYKTALEMHELYVKMKDSVINTENRKMAIQKNFQYEYDKKASLLKLEQDKKDAIAKERDKKQQIVIYIISGSLLIVLLFAMLLNRNYKVGKRKSIIIKKQKELVEAKQKEILDSINYARRIQYTLLANDELLKSGLSDYFVLFKPKDIVSGDFYWATKKENSFYIAVCDCTGHGVPGAFMSLLNISLLNEAINEKNISSPDAILNYVREKLILHIAQEGARDGMDAVLLKIDKDNEGLAVSYAAAHNSPYYIKNGSGSVMPCDKMPVGKSEYTTPFTFNSFQLKKGEMLYCFTDGYADQFGGEKGKKLKSKNLKEILLEYSMLPLEEQKNKLDRFFEEWRSDYEQVDDVLLFGLKA